MELIQQMALVSEVSEISASQLSRASAALSGWVMPAEVAALDREHPSIGNESAAGASEQLEPPR
jgi:hypothetical protein